MAPTQFKLSQASGLTRRILFPELPSWSTLATKIESLYHVPIEHIGVAYTDNDGDQVTLSSEDELQDFYTNCHKPSETVKLTVQDLGSLRSSPRLSSKVGTETPQNTNYRNTFGGNDAIGMGFEVDDDWQRLPHGLGSLFGPRSAGSEGLYGNLDSPTAFIEVLESDASSVNSDKRDTDIVADTTMESDQSSYSIPATNKGKGKAHGKMQPSVSDDVSSTGSVLIDEVNVKFPVHVLDVGNEGMMEPIVIDNNAHPGVDSPHSTVVPIQAESTPIDKAKPFPSVESTKTAAAQTEMVADPPLPSIDFAPTASPVSFTHDVATFLNSLSTVLSSHPELSEGVRNITRNVTSGTYWSAHRQAVSRAAEEFRRSATEESGQVAEDFRRAAEEEAGRRVADALGGLMRIFGDMRRFRPGDEGLGQPNSQQCRRRLCSTHYCPIFGDLHSAHSIPPPVPRDGTPPPRRPFGRNSHGRFAPPNPAGPFPPPGPPPPPHWRRGGFGPPPIFTDSQGPFGPPLGPPHRAHWGSPCWGRPSPPGGPNRGPPPFHDPFVPTGPKASSSPRAEQPPFLDTSRLWVGPGPSTTPSPTELKVLGLETAKQHYKQEKRDVSQST